MNVRLFRHTALAAAMLALAACGGGDAAPKPPAASPETAPGAAPAPSARQDTGTWIPAARGDVREILPVIGSFEARRTSRLGPQVSGRLDDVLVDVGDVVRAGQEVARVDRTSFAIEADQAKAAITSAEARAASAEQSVVTAGADVRQAEVRLRETETDFERMRSLWEQPTGGVPSIPKSRFDDAGFRRDQARAGLDAAKSRVTEAEVRREESKAAVHQAREALRLAEQKLKETVIRAPYDGVVTARFVDPGEPVTSAPVTHVIEIRETATLELLFSLPQAYVGAVADGAAGSAISYQVEGLAGASGTAQVSTVFPAMDEATRSVRCRAIVDNAAGKLRPGLLAQVRVTVREAKGVVTVPAAALSSGPGGWRVVVEKDGAREARIVEPGIRGDDAVEIRRGLAEGERVLMPSVPGAAR